MLAGCQLLNSIGGGNGGGSGNGNDNPGFSIKASFTGANGDAALELSENGSAKSARAAENSIPVSGTLVDGDITFKMKGNYDKQSGAYTASAVASTFRYVVSGQTAQSASGDTPATDTSMTISINTRANKDADWSAPIIISTSKDESTAGAGSIDIGDSVAVTPKGKVQESEADITGLPTDYQGTWYDAGKQPFIFVFSDWNIQGFQRISAKRNMQTVSYQIFDVTKRDTVSAYLGDNALGYDLIIQMLMPYDGENYNSGTKIQYLKFALVKNSSGTLTLYTPSSGYKDTLAEAKAYTFDYIGTNAPEYKDGEKEPLQATDPGFSGLIWPKLTITGFPVSGREQGGGGSVNVFIYNAILGPIEYASTQAVAFGFSYAQGTGTQDLVIDQINWQVGRVEDKEYAVVLEGVGYANNVTFKDGAATVAYSAFTAFTGNAYAPTVKTGALTINGLALGLDAIGNGNELNGVRVLKTNLKPLTNVNTPGAFTKAAEAPAPAEDKSLANPSNITWYEEPSGTYAVLISYTVHTSTPFGDDYNRQQEQFYMYKNGVSFDSFGNATVKLDEMTRNNTGRIVTYTPVQDAITISGLGDSEIYQITVGQLASDWKTTLELEYPYANFDSSLQSVARWWSPASVANFYGEDPTSTPSYSNGTVTLPLEWAEGADKEGSTFGIDITLGEDGKNGKRLGPYTFDKNGVVSAAVDFTDGTKLLMNLGDNKKTVRNALKITNLNGATITSVNIGVSRDHSFTYMGGASKYSGSLPNVNGNVAIEWYEVYPTASYTVEICSGDPENPIVKGYDNVEFVSGVVTKVNGVKTNEFNWETMPLLRSATVVDAITINGLPADVSGIVVSSATGESGVTTAAIYDGVVASYATETVSQASSVPLSWYGPVTDVDTSQVKAGALIDGTYTVYVIVDNMGGKYGSVTFANGKATGGALDYSAMTEFGPQPEDPTPAQGKII
ncbi:MAG: hypothetical protein LBM77_04535 [Spirochaetaceae bacterium]|nr:hypothetical protein [Spirochaetaceae bacterium]